ncbi:MAG: hypothetical protein EBT54_01400 [Betaproteobacteria bacterium]|nr:hypothetical protein [Betaproteobacteria bacterium]
MAGWGLALRRGARSERKSSKDHDRNQAKSGQSDSQRIEPGQPNKQGRGDGGYAKHAYYREPTP